jgi:small GTP-binding protein
MKIAQPADIRNFALVGHATSGKTTLAEAMLYCGGAISRLGSVAQGSTVSDYHVGEQQRHISIHGTTLHCAWQGRQLNFIDTPGYLDFSSEAIHALRVADFAVVVIHASHGIGVGTEMMWDYAGQFGIPRIIVINALDKENYDFDALVEEIRGRFGREIFPMQVPVDAGPGFHQVLDVLRSEIVSYATDKSGKYTEGPATGAWGERVKGLHQELIEHVAETDDTLLQKFFDEGGLSEEVLRTGIHPAVQRQAFVPLFCTAGETNIGVARLLDFIARFGSSPADRRTVGGDGGGDRRAVSRGARRGGAGGLRVQDADRSAERRSVHFSRLFRDGAGRHGTLQQRPAHHGTAGATVPAQWKIADAGRTLECGGHGRGGEAPGHAYGQHAMRSAAWGRVAEGGLSRALYARGAAAQYAGGRGPARHGPRGVARGRSGIQLPHRRGTASVYLVGPGRTAPGSFIRAAQAPLQGRHRAHAAAHPLS